MYAFSQPFYGQNIFYKSSNEDKIARFFSFRLFLSKFIKYPCRLRFLIKETRYKRNNCCVKSKIAKFLRVCLVLDHLYSRESRLFHNSHPSHPLPNRIKYILFRWDIQNVKKPRRGNDTAESRKQYFSKNRVVIHNVESWLRDMDSQHCVKSHF